MKVKVTINDGNYYKWSDAQWSTPDDGSLSIYTLVDNGGVGYRSKLIAQFAPGTWLLVEFVEKMEKNSL